MTAQQDDNSGRRTLAAVDLGSNSFHMVVARANGHQLEVIDRLQEPVRLAAGIDAKQHLDDAARKRALACLARFGQRLSALPSVQVRAVGTNTLRRTEPAGRFLQAAEHALGHPIDVIYGAEEARLIYAGVTLDLGQAQPQRLVIDIGGGSTELIIGHGATPRLLESLSLGAVSHSQRYFPGGEVSRARWRDAVIDARLTLAPVARAYRAAGWDLAIGASGSIKAMRRICLDAGWIDGDITPEALHKLARTLCKAGHIDAAGLASLSDSRRPVFAGAVAILAAVFESLDIQAMTVSEKALREGMLLDLLKPTREHDPRGNGVVEAQRRYVVDTDHAQRVARTARILQAGVNDWLPAAGYVDLLYWAAQLHEIGMAITHKGYHIHGAYIVRNADLHGFARTEQLIMAALLHLQRGKFRRSAALDDVPEIRRQLVERLALILRLSVLLNRDRDPDRPLPVQLNAADHTLQLAFPRGWLDSQPLTRADLIREQDRLREAGYTLDIEPY